MRIKTASLQLVIVLQQPCKHEATMPLLLASEVCLFAGGKDERNCKAQSQRREEEIRVGGEFIYSLIIFFLANWQLRDCLFRISDNFLEGCHS